MTGLQFVLFGVLFPLVTAGLGIWVGWALHKRRMDDQLGAAYDRGWDNAVMATTFPPKAVAVLTEDRPRPVRRPGRHASTQLPDPPKAAPAASLPPEPEGDNIGGKAS